MMATETREYSAWSPFYSQFGPNRKFTPTIFYESIGDMRPLFKTKQACQEWINGKECKKYFGMHPAKVIVTIAWESKEAP